MDEDSEQRVEGSSILATAGLDFASISRLEDLFSELDEFGDQIAQLEYNARYWERKYRQSTEELEQTRKDLEAMTAEFNTEASQHWALRHDYDEKSHEVEVLRLQLRNSISLRDWRSPPPKPKTALEACQEDRIEKLKQEIENLQREIKCLKENKGRESERDHLSKVAA